MKDLRPAWISRDGPDTEVVVSSRCRIARNLDSIPFPWRASELQRRTVLRAISDAVARAEGDLGSVRRVLPAELAERDVEELLEWRFISLDWMRGSSHRSLIVLHDHPTSLMINEEYHLRVQSLLPGLQVESVYRSASWSLASLGRVLRFANDGAVGYLTASLVNAGAGIRLSVLLHLPGLAATAMLEPALEASRLLGSS